MKARLAATVLLLFCSACSIGRKNECRRFEQLTRFNAGAAFGDPSRGDRRAIAFAARLRADAARRLATTADTAFSDDDTKKAAGELARAHRDYAAAGEEYAAKLEALDDRAAESALQRAEASRVEISSGHAKVRDLCSE